MSNLLSNTPYDDAYRTMFVSCDELIYPLINEVFGEHYTGTEKLIRRQNEHYAMYQEGAEDKYITDCVLDIVGSTVKKYHCECQSEADDTITIRMFQYGSEIAIEDATIEDDGLHIELPHAAVIFLRCRENMSDELKVYVKAPNGMELSYPIHILKIKDYDIDDLFDKKLYILIPFYIFNLEHKLKECDRDEKELNDLLKLYIDIINRLENLTNKGEIKVFNECIIKDLSNKVAQNLAYKYENVREGIGDIMGGKVLELEAIKIKRDAVKQGIEQGGEMVLIEQVIKKIEKNKPVSVIAEELEEDVPHIEEIYKAAKKHAPDYNVEMIFNELSLNTAQG